MLALSKKAVIYKLEFVGKGNNMFEILLTCSLEELLGYTETLSAQIETAEEAEKLIRMLWKRVPELTVQQEKDLHKLARKIRKRFHLKPIRE